MTLFSKADWSLINIQIETKPGDISFNLLI
jgi:hypothetical protein